MRIGLAIDRFDPLYGGAEQWTWQFASGLLERGHEVHVVARRFGDDLQGVPIVAHLLDGAGRRLAFAEAAEAKLRSLRADAVHDLGWGWFCDVFQPRGGSWTATCQQKLLMTSRPIRPWKRCIDCLLPRYRRFQRLLARQYADNGQVLVALSQRGAEDFQRFHGVGPQRIRVIPNGVNTERFSPARRAEHRQAVRRRLGIGDGTLLLMIAAHNFPLKGVPTLLRAMRRFTARQTPVHLVVVGGRHMRRHVRAAGRQGIAKAVTFAGPVPDTMPFYAAADVYVHPTYYDSFGLVILEAAASGLPVVTSRFAGAAELLTDGVDGFVLPDPADVTELVSRVQLLFDPAVRRGMGEAARQLALKHPFSRNVDAIVSLYREIAASSRLAA